MLRYKLLTTEQQYRVQKQQILARMLIKLQLVSGDIDIFIAVLDRVECRLDDDATNHN